MMTSRIQFFSVALALTTCSWAAAGTLVDFKPLPISPSVPEFTFSRALGGGIPVFRGANGATGNADGTLPVVNQTPGGFLAEVPFIIGGIPGSQFAASSTLFFDATLQFTTGLAASGPAVNAGGVFIQPLSAGSFNLLSTDPDAAGPLLPTLILSGNINAASFIVGTGDAGATFNASGVTYTGGVAYTALVSSGGSASGGSMSLSLADVTLPFAIAGDGFLRDFTANSTGQFSTVPEPTSLSLLVIAVGSLYLRRR